jgi:hypothetical protein
MSSPLGIRVLHDIAQVEVTYMPCLCDLVVIHLPASLLSACLSACLTDSLTN